MIGVSLPFKWLLTGGGSLGSRAALLSALKERGTESIELRTVRPDHDAADVLRVAELLWNSGFQITVHSSVKSAETAAEDVFSPLSALLRALRQKHLTVTVHPIDGDNVQMLRGLSKVITMHGYPVTVALENNRLLPDRSEGDSAALVLAAVKETALPNVGICFDMGHYLYYRKKNFPNEPFVLPEKSFLSRVVHTHIHALNGFSTHYPLGTHELPVKELLNALSFEYFGVYNIELSFPRFEAISEPVPALLGSVDALKASLPRTARLYDRLRLEFDESFRRMLLSLERVSGSAFGLIHASSYLFSTNGFRWAMDVAFRNIRRLAKTPAIADVLLKQTELMIISHGHADHFEESTVRLLSALPMRWLIPDFLYEKAISYGIPKERITVAHAGDVLCIGPLTIHVFEGHHFRPVTGQGALEYGYHVSAMDAPSLVFPVDVRDFSLTGLPSLPPADYCFANVWLGDNAAAASDYGERLTEFARFMLRFSDRCIVYTHLYENGRNDANLWTEEHARLISDAVTALSPTTKAIIPECGELIEL